MLRQSEPNQVVVRHHWLADYTISFGLLRKKLMVPPLLLWRQETFYIPMSKAYQYGIRIFSFHFRVSCQ